MIAHRAALFLAGATSLALLPNPAAAQVDESIVLNILRNCAQIDEPNARLACYDNNIRAAGVEPRNTVPGRSVQGGGAPLSGAGGSVTGFGREDVRTPDRFLPAPPGELEEITVRVSEIRSIGPGLWEVTLDDGAVWRYTDGAGPNYSPPRVGSEVEIMRGAIGSFLLRYRNQQPARVERIR